MSADPKIFGEELQTCLQAIQDLRDPEARQTAETCLQTLMEFYGHGLKRILRLLSIDGAGGKKLKEDLTADPVVSSLLLIHGLHPVDLKTRLQGAVEKVLPYLKSHGGGVEVVSLVEEVAILRVTGNFNTGVASPLTLETAIKEAVAEACPDLVELRVEGMGPVSS